MKIRNHLKLIKFHSPNRFPLLLIATMLLGLLALKNSSAQLIQQPTFQASFSNSPGYRVDEYQIGIFRGSSPQSAYGFLVPFSKFLGKDKDGNDAYDYQQSFVWLDAQGKLIGIWRAPETASFLEIVSLTNSRAVLMDYGSGEIFLHYLSRSGKSIIHRVADGLVDHFSAGMYQKSMEHMLRHGFARVSQNNDLDKTTIEYFAP